MPKCEFCGRNFKTQKGLNKHWNSESKKVVKAVYEWCK